MEKEAGTLILLAAAAIHHTPPDREAVSGADMGALFAFAARHQMTSVVYAGLKEAGLDDEDFAAEARRQTIKAALVEMDYEKVREALEEAGIWYMPLKGTVLREYYPSPELRQMVDVDILIDASRTGEVRQIMQAQGFDMDPEDEIEHQDVFRKRPASVFEMHNMLFDELSDRKLYTYYQSIGDKLLQDGSARRLSDEDFYIYLIAHEFKHYYWCGIGLRSLLDTYVFLQRFGETMDWAYIRAEAQKLGIRDFETRNRELAQKVFADGHLDALSEDEKAMLDYMAASGVHGTGEFSILNRMNRVGTFRYWRERIFLPLSAVRFHYPFFYRHRILLPFLPVYRLFHGWRNARAELRVIRGREGSLVNKARGKNADGAMKGKT